VNRKFNIDQNIESRMFYIGLTLWPVMIFLLFLIISNITFSCIIAGIVVLFLMIQNKLLTKHFIHEYDMGKDSLKLNYSQNGETKEIELRKGKFKIERSFTVLYARPGKKNDYYMERRKHQSILDWELERIQNERTD